MKMKRIGLAAGVLALVSVSAAAQEHWTEGNVWECSSYRTNPGQFDTYMKWLRSHALVTTSEAKKQGLIVDYKVFVKAPRDADDYDVMICNAAYELCEGARLQPGGRRQVRRDLRSALEYVESGRADGQVGSPTRDAQVPRHELRSRGDAAPGRVIQEGLRPRKPASCRLSFFLARRLRLACGRGLERRDVDAGRQRGLQLVHAGGIA